MSFMENMSLSTLVKISKYNRKGYHLFLLKKGGNKFESNYLTKTDYAMIILNKRRKICGIFRAYLAIQHYFIIFVAEYAAFNAVILTR